MTVLSPIEVDEREPLAIYAGLLAENVQAERKLMETGDYRFTRKDSTTGEEIEVLIERMTYSNLLQKIQSGELAEQMRRLMAPPQLIVKFQAEKFSITEQLGKGQVIFVDPGEEIEYLPPNRLVFILIEGQLEVYNDQVNIISDWYTVGTRWKYSAIGDYLVTLQLAGALLIFSPSLKDTPKRIKDIYYLGNDRHDSLRRPYRPTQPSLEPLTIPEQVLTGIPTVGPDLAAKLLRKFHTIEDVTRASVKELMEVKGVGKKTAQYIYDIVRGGSNDN